MANHLRASQSARAKSIIRFFGVSNSNSNAVSNNNNNNSELYFHEYKRAKYDIYGNLVISWELSRLMISVARDPENKRREGEVVCSHCIVA